MEELNYNVYEIQKEHSKLFEGLNEEQRIIYDSVLDSIKKDQDFLFFVYDHGGTGKIYLWWAIIMKICFEEKIILTVASSGIVSL